MKLSEIARFKYKPCADYFDLRELYDERTYNCFGGNRLANFLNDSAINALLYIRHTLDVPITVNNWHVGGQYKYSGFRPMDVPIGAAASAHKLNMAYDLKFLGMTPEEAFIELMKRENTLFYVGVRRIEHLAHTPTWLHFDVLNDIDMKAGEIKIILP